MEKIFALVCGSSLSRWRRVDENLLLIVQLEQSFDGHTSWMQGNLSF